MTQDEIIEYCMTKKSAYIDFPFGESPTCIRIQAGKHTPIFAQVYYPEDGNKITVRCDPMLAIMYRQSYPETISRGYYCPPCQQPYWNTILLDGKLDDEIIISMLDEAHRAAVSKLPKYLQKEFDYGVR